MLLKIVAVPLYKNAKQSSSILHFLILGVLFSLGDHNTNECVVSRLVDESPRWLWAQGQAQKAVAIVEKAMKQNGCTEKLDVAYFVTKGEGKIIVSDTPSAGLTDLVKTPNLRNRTFNVVFNWCVFCVFNLPTGEEENILNTLHSFPGILQVDGTEGSGHQTGLLVKIFGDQTAVTLE